jgi:GNAT superfamily N-acetyltransferase
MDAGEVASGWSLHRIASPKELEGFRLDPLSEYFAPFLRHFAAETLRCDETVQVAGTPPRARGMFLTNTRERVASAFTRDRRLAETLFRTPGPEGFFSEFDLGPGTETYDVLAADWGATEAPPPFVHPVRVVRAEDRPAITSLLAEIYGAVDERWLAQTPHDEEVGLLVELEGQVVGVGWMCVVGPAARFHSLSVRPGFRRRGIGRDLWSARIRWAQRAGVTHGVTEISQHNAASRSLALRAGLRPVGAIYLTPRA